MEHGGSQVSVRPAGACRTVNPEVFFGPADSPEGGATFRWELRAKQVCERCPLRAACLAEALEFPASEQDGVVGGLTAGERKQVIRLSGRRPSRTYRANVEELQARLREEQLRRCTDVERRHLEAADAAARLRAQRSAVRVKSGSAA